MAFFKTAFKSESSLAEEFFFVDIVDTISEFFSFDGKTFVGSGFFSFYYGGSIFSLTGLVLTDSFF